MAALHARLRRPAVAGTLVLAAAAAALAVPGAASAKTFVSHIPDAKGDAKKSAFDITGVRVAYNRKSGAVSATLTVSGSIDTGSDAVFAVGLSDLVDGKCKKAVMLVGGVFSSPDLGVGQLMNAKGPFGKTYTGSGSVDDDTFSVRVKSKALSGRTVGCAYGVITANTAKGEKPVIYDETKGNDGFFG